jgi:hypothetical protein
MGKVAWVMMRELASGASGSELVQAIRPWQPVPPEEAGRLLVMTLV